MLQTRLTDRLAIQYPLMGQSAAFVDAARPAGEIVRSICEDAEGCLRERAAGLLRD